MQLVACDDCVGVRNQTQAFLAPEPKLCSSALLLYNPPPFGSGPRYSLFLKIIFKRLYLFTFRERGRGGE